MVDNYEESVRGAPPGTKETTAGYAMAALVALGCVGLLVGGWLATTRWEHQPRELPPFATNQIVSMKLDDRKVMVVSTNYYGAKWNCKIRYPLASGEYALTTVSCWELEVRGPSE